MRSPATRSVAAEAVALYARLHEITDQVGTAFDLSTVAESALDDLEAVLHVDIAAIYGTTTGSRPVVVAVRGSDRAPWPDPDDPSGPLDAAWRTGGPVVAQLGENRFVVAQTLLSAEGRHVGIIAAERASGPFDAREQEALADLARDYGDIVQAGLLAAWLRARTSHEEHGRVAHQIHNGVAQELVALGFQVDSMRLGPAGQDPATRGQLDEVRESINRTVADIRARLADLQTDPRPDSGVGALIVDRFQLVGAYTGLTVRFTLREGGSRPPANVEATVFRLALDVIVDATRVPDARTLELSLTADSQAVRLEVFHDGSSTGLDEARIKAHRLLRSGATVSFSGPGEGHGPHLFFAWDRTPIDAV